MVRHSLGMFLRNTDFNEASRQLATSFQIYQKLRNKDDEIRVWYNYREIIKQLIKRGEFEIALQTIQEFQKIVPDSVENQLLYVEILSKEQQKYSEALIYVNKIISENPNHATSLIMIMLIFLSH